MKNAIILMGLPLAGKSTWIKEQTNLSDYKIVSAEEIKINQIGYSPDKAYLFHEYSVNVAKELMTFYSDLEHDLIMDSGSINNSYSQEIINMLKSKDYKIKLVHIKTPLLICLDRNKIRDRKVPNEEIIKKSQIETKQFNKLKLIVDEYEVIDYFTNEHIFIDMDGVLASQTTLPIIDGKIDFVNSEIFKHQLPVMPVIEKFKSLNDKGYKLYILSAIPNSFSLKEKEEWLDEHFNIIPKENRFFVNQGKHKAEMLNDIRKMLKLKKQQITLVDDYHTTLYDVLESRMNPMHISEFLTYNFK